MTAATTTAADSGPPGPSPEQPEVPPARPAPGAARRGVIGVDAFVILVITVIEYAVVASLLLVSAVVLVRTAINFFFSSLDLAQSVVGAVDGILVVIILLDIVHTVFRHVRNAAFPVRPFLVIGILAAIRDILSASAHLTLGANLTSSDIDTTLLELGVGVGAVVVLLFGLWLLGVSGHQDEGVDASG